MSGSHDDNRLTTISNALGSVSMGYDAADRPTSITLPNARVALPALTSSSSYNRDNALTARDGATFDYDADGRLV